MVCQKFLLESPKQCNAHLGDDKTGNTITKTITITVTFSITKLRTIFKDMQRISINICILTHQIQSISKFYIDKSQMTGQIQQDSNAATQQQEQNTKRIRYLWFTWAT